ncbi:MAG: ABC transporter permease [Prolixibacteraceae bacterium]|nr:ABC transporter permease [Prolixibacteraceae bacterium]
MKNIKLAIQNLKRNKVFTLITFVSLTIAFSVSIVLFMYGFYHYSFDKHIPNHENTYRIISCVKNGEYRASTFAAFEEPLNNCSEIESITTFYCHHQEQEFAVGNHNFTLQKILQADAGFLKFFGIKPKTGTLAELDNPNTAMLSKSTAKLIFGDVDPIGKAILTGNGSPGNSSQTAYTVVGVVEQIPGNSHLGYDIILSKKGDFESPIKDIKNSKTFGAYIYVKSLHPLQNSNLENQLSTLVSPALNDKHGPPLNAFQHKFQKLDDIHFNTDIRNDFGIPINKSNLNILFIIGLIVLLSVSINLLILNLGVSAFRIKQTRVLNFLGGKPYQILNPAFWENLFIIFLSFATTFILIQFLKPQITNFLSNIWAVSFNLIPIVVFLIFLLLLVVFISWFSTTDLKNKITPKFNSRMSGSKTATPLIIFQFVAVIALLSFTILIKKQLHYIENKQLGFTAENVAIFHINGPRTDKVIDLKQRINQIPGVESAGIALHFPGRNFQNLNLETKVDNFPFEFAMADMDAIQTLGIKTISNFSDSETTSIFINETFYNALSKRFSEQQIMNGNFSEDFNADDPNMMKFAVNGVVSDFHYNPLYSTIGNFAVFVGNPQTYPDRYLLARVKQTNVQEITAKIAEEINILFPENNSEPTFLDDQLHLKYILDEQLLKVTNLFFWITVMITCFGLFAFSFTKIQQKTKEIGIRKVNGARISEVLVMLNKDFVKWVAVAFVIATPIAYYAMHKWLENFAYKTELSWWIFALAGLLALGITLLTVSWQSWWAATKNPVEALRYE